MQLRRKNLLSFSFTLGLFLFGSPKAWAKPDIKELKKSTIQKLLDKRTGGVMPPEFDQVIQLLKIEGELPGGVIIPKGRSLQKDEVTESSPRSVATSIQNNKGAVPAHGAVDRTGEPSTFLEGRFFIGFAEGKKEGSSSSKKKLNIREIISMNEDGEFDFLLGKPATKDAVEAFVDLFSLEPRLPTDILISFADRDTCMECHAHGGPIFSEGPWTEINMQHPKAKGNTRFAKSLLNHRGLVSIGDKVEKGDTAARAFDMAVHVGNRLLQANRICRKVCDKQGSSCRAMILQSALLNKKQSPYIRTFVGSVKRKEDLPKPKDEADLYLSRIVVPKSIRKELRNFEFIWPNDSFEYPSHVLIDPTRAKKENKKVSPRISVSKRDDHDGVTPSQAPNYIYDVSGECLGWSQKYFDQLKDVNESTVLAFAKTEEFESFVDGPWPPNADKVVNAAVKFAKNNPAGGGEKRETILTREQKSERSYINNASAPQLLNRYCRECHVEGDNTPIPVDKSISASFLRRWGDKIAEELVNNRMPHRSAKQHKLVASNKKILQDKILSYLRAKEVTIPKADR